MIMRRGTGLMPLLCILLGGCGVNALRTDAAVDVARATDGAVASGQAFLASVDAERTAANIDLAVADPACATQDPVIKDPLDVAPGAPAVGYLCIVAPKPGQGRPLSFAPIGDDLAPTLALLGAVAAYGDGLSAIISRDRGDPPTQAFGRALELARAAQSALTAVAGRPDGPILGTDDPRITAAGGLVDFLAGLAKEGAQVRDLRAYVVANPDGPAASLRLLERHIQTWERARGGDAALRLVVAAAIERHVLDVRPPLDAQLRRAALTSFYAVQREAVEERGLAPVVLSALAAVSTADRAMRDVLVEHPHLSGPQRREVAELNRRRIVDALGGVAALANSIRKAGI